MNIREIFKKGKKKRHFAMPHDDARLTEDLLNCEKCNHVMKKADFTEAFGVCDRCGHHHKMHAQDRLAITLDEGSFVELDASLDSANPLEFPGYLEKVKADQQKTGLTEAIVTGKGKIGGEQVVVAVMDAHFRMGSMGSVVGEKITRAVETATELGVPFIIFTASGGARMQEGVLSLMQMAKTSVALKRHADKGLLFISVMTHPTTGGVSASFASVGDINLAEPQALIGFAGRRVIEQTVREKLPDDFQTAEFLLEHGQLDAIIERKNMRQTLSTFVKLHTKGAAHHG